MSRVRKPPHDVVRRIIEFEARRAGVTITQIVGRSFAPGVKAARLRAMRRIRRETGCSPAGIALVWGCSHITVRRALRAPEPAEPPPRIIAPLVSPYDPGTIERLRWRYGDARTSQIIAGNDPRTQADLAKWRALGSGRSSAA